MISMSGLSNLITTRTHFLPQSTLSFAQREHRGLLLLALFILEKPILISDKKQLVFEHDAVYKESKNIHPTKTLVILLSKVRV